MERQYPTRILKVLSLTAPTISQVEEALAYSQQAILQVFPRREVTIVGQSMKPKAYETAQLVLKSLLARFTKVFLLYSCDQLLTLLGACLCSKYSVQICDIALQYTQQLIEALPLLAFRRIGEEFKVELYGILAFFSGALALLVPQVLQNGMMTKVLKILHNLNQKGVEASGTRVLGELLLVESVSARLEEESKKAFWAFLKGITKGQSKETLYNLVLNTQTDRLLEFSKLVVIRVVDDVLEKVDLNLNVRSRELFMMPSPNKCWPEWVETSYQSKPSLAHVEPLTDSPKLQEVYQCFQQLQLWASSPQIQDPSLHLNQEITDLFINYLEGKPFSGSRYEFRLERWKEKCVQIQQMLLGVRDRQKQTLRELFANVL